MNQGITSLQPCSPLLTFVQSTSDFDTRRTNHCQESTLVSGGKVSFCDNERSDFLACFARFGNLASFPKRGATSFSTHRPWCRNNSTVFQAGTCEGAKFRRATVA